MLEVSAIPSSIGHDESVPSTPAQTFPTWVDRDDVHDSSSVSSESCWGEREDLNEDDNVEWGLLPPESPVAAHPADIVRGSVPPDVLSALEQDLCEQGHGSRSPSANQVSTVQNSPVQEIGRLVRPHQESVPPVRLKNRFSLLVESPIVRDTVINAPGVFPMTDGAEEEMSPS